MYVYIYTQEVQADQTLPIGRIGNPLPGSSWRPATLFGLGLPGYIYICAMVKSRYIGDGHPTFNYNGYINPYYWVDEFFPYYMEIMGV